VRGMRFERSLCGLPSDLLGANRSGGQMGSLVRLLVVAITAISTVVALPSPAQVASVRHTFLQFNMCGNSCNGGRLTVAHDLINLINTSQPFAVTLNEVCRSQYSHLSTSLRPYFGRFETTVARRCNDGSDYGIAILLRTASFSFVGAWWLPNPHALEPRKVMCLQVGATQPLVACVTHIDHHADTYPAQIQAVADRVGVFSAGNPVMIGGDFDVTPPHVSLNPMYSASHHPAGSGIFDEADAPSSLNRIVVGSAVNERTWGSKKIDYIFLSSRDFTSYSADATYSLNSDHDPLWATVTFRSG
jgi:endonuclease/exonuclease/phosphatase family metal-dependent hydrolase